MNDFYPIYKSKLKPWIKFWILKGNKIAPKVLSELIEGTSPITIEKAYEETTLQEIAFKGQTIQNRVVKEDNYININEESYKVDLGGKNLLNLSAFTTTTSNGITVTPVINNGVLEYLESSGAYSRQTYITLTNNLKLEPNTQYFLSGAYNASARLRLREYNSSGSNLSEYFDSGSGISFTTKSNVSYINVQIVFYAQNNVKFYPQIEQGSQATPYSPYTDNPIELSENDKIWNDEGIWRLNNSEITNINLIEQLETIKNATLISGTNEITQTPDDLPFILNFKYYMKG